MVEMTYAANEKAIERFLLGIYTLYTSTLMLISDTNQWAEINDVVWVVGLLIAYFMYIGKYKTYAIRMKILAVLMQVSVVLYAVHTKEFQDAIPTFMVFVVLLGLIGIEGLIYITLLPIACIFLYHVWIVKTITAANLPIACSQLANVLLLQYTIYVWTKRNRLGSEQLLNVIEELKIAQSGKNDFVANVSHEIRTPINTICGMSEIILREELPEQIKENVISMQMAGRNLMGVVSNILDFSELQTGKIELEEEDYNITTTINDVIGMTMAKKNEKNLELIVNCDATMPSVLLGDEKKLRRIVMNLVDNAVKFTETGGVILQIGYRKEEYGVNLVVSVKDTGIGISESNLEKIFTSFNQVDASRKRQEGGLGLGLAISNALIRKMGGAITIKSKVGKGTTVQVVVPQKVLDETPIAMLQDRRAIKVATYIDMEQFDNVAIRDEYTAMIVNMVEQLRGKCHICRNLAELQRRESAERFSHIFISVVEYKKDKEYFDELAGKTNVAVVLNRFEEKYIDSQKILKIYKPFHILSIVSVLNNTYEGEREGYQLITEEFTTKNAHVLVVDDNRMNIRVMEDILGYYNIKVTTAASGKEALQKIVTSDYDFVFMDHMMPEMDGVETLHAIRAMIGNYYAKVPIVAVTANTVAGTREALITEGFDDFMEKPVERSVLERIIKRILPKEKIVMNQTDVKEEVLKQEQSDDIDGIEGLDVKQGMRYCNGRTAYISVLQACCRDYNNTAALARESFAKQDWKNYTIAVHGLKSALFSIGATKISDMTKALEMAGKENRISYIEEHHQELMTEYENLFERMKKNKIICPQAQDEESDVKALPELKPEELEKAVKNMEDAMYALDGEILLEVIEELEAYQYKGQSMKKTLEPVKKKVEMSDFFSAVDMVMRWKTEADSKENS